MPAAAHGDVSVAMAPNGRNMKAIRVLKPFFGFAPPMPDPIMRDRHRGQRPKLNDRAMAALGQSKVNVISQIELYEKRGQPQL
jgi:hypothetical protein